MDGLQHQYPCSFLLLFFVQYLMVSAVWNEDVSNFIPDSNNPVESFQKYIFFMQNINPCYVNNYSEKCRFFRKMIRGAQFINNFSEEKSKLQWEREKKLSKISVSINAKTCPCEYNRTNIDLGDNDYFPSKISKVNCGFTKNIEKCQRYGWCQRKEWVIDVLKRQAAPSSFYAGPQRINVMPNDLNDSWEIVSVTTTVACIWTPK